MTKPCKPALGCPVCHGEPVKDNYSDYTLRCIMHNYACAIESGFDDPTDMPSYLWRLSSDSGRHIQELDKLLSEALSRLCGDHGETND